MARSHVMTPARRAALRKAQLVSARKRRRRSGNNLASSSRRVVRQGLQRRKARLDSYHPTVRGMGGRKVTRRQVRNARIQSAATVAVSSAYVGYMLTTKQERKKMYTSTKGVYSGSKKKIQTHRTNRQFNKIIASNYSPKKVQGAKLKRKLF